VTLKNILAMVSNFKITKQFETSQALCDPKQDQHAIGPPA
jgi:hypothetical protein